jgi:sugar lactone lactonase YvrE
MVTDSAGRSWVGDIGFDWFADAERRPGRIWYVAPDGTCRLAADGLSFPNGMVITDDGKRLIVAESLGGKLSRFDIASDGRLVNPCDFAVCDDAPDGICLDAEGAIWVADPWSNQARRIFEGGRVAQTVKIAEGRHVYACALGGPERRSDPRG